jgi:hypothetical protein
MVISSHIIAVLKGKFLKHRTVFTTGKKLASLCLKFSLETWSTSGWSLLSEEVFFSGAM